MLLRNSYARLLRSLGFYPQLTSRTRITYNGIVLEFNENTRYVTVYIPYLTAITINVPYQVTDRLHMRITQHINGITNRVNHFSQPRSPTKLVSYTKTDKYSWMSERAAMYKPLPFNQFN